MPKIASTMTSDVNYVLYHVNQNGPHIVEKKILIKGQAGVMQRSKDNRLWTPEGTINTVSEEDLELLKKDETFQQHLKFGAVKILKSNSAKIEKVAKDMQKDAKAAPLTEKDYKAGGRVPIPKEMQVNGGRGLQ